MYYSALIGNPTDHSVSPTLFESLANHAGLKEDYRHIKINVEAKDLASTLKSLDTLHFIGVNVTLPYKLDVMELVEPDPIAEAIGAVNTIVFGDKVVGHNTDWTGVVKSIDNGQRNKRVDTALIFGSGGAAHAALYACRKMGARRIIVVCRDIKKSKLQNGPRVRINDYSSIEKLVNQADLILNCTSTGMIGNEPYPFDLNRLDKINIADKTYFDAVFNPVNTPMLGYFRQKGATTIDGLWMMIYQAVSALSLWLDQDLNFGYDTLRTIHRQLESELQHA